jgi:hypothetical protein
MRKRTFKNRKKGRPRRTWPEEIKAVVGKRGGSWEEVKQKTQDGKERKEMWREKIDTIT